MNTIPAMLANSNAKSTGALKLKAVNPPWKLALANQNWEAAAANEFAKAAELPSDHKTVHLSHWERGATGS